MIVTTIKKYFNFLVQNQTPNMETLKNLAEELVELKENHKEFKKENKDVFLEHRNYNKAIKAKEEELIEVLKDQNIDNYEHKGMQFELKERSFEKHNMEVLEELISDSEKFSAYVNSVKTVKPKVATRKTKRQRVED